MRLLIIIMLMVFSSCTSSSDVHKALEAEGYTDIEVGGWAPFKCDRNDTYKTSFCATNSKGKKVCGAVCSSWLKGATIRY